MPLNATLIRESFEALRPHADEVMSHFYETLFKKRPAARGLFQGVDMNKQRKALAGSLSHIVEFLDDSEHLPDYLKKMGTRHASYDVKDEHYDWVGEALLATFEYYFEDQWTDELKSQWIQAYTVVSSVMKEGMHMAYASKPVPISKPEPKKDAPLEEIARNLAQELFKMALEDEVNGATLNLAREKIRAILKTILEEEAGNVLASFKRKAA